jgi:hypothetical protein
MFCIMQFIIFAHSTATILAATSVFSRYFDVSNRSDRLSGDFEQLGRHSKPPGLGRRCELRERKKRKPNKWSPHKTAMLNVSSSKWAGPEPREEFPER